MSQSPYNQHTNQQQNQQFQGQLGQQQQQQQYLPQQQQIPQQCTQLQQQPPQYGQLPNSNFGQNQQFPNNFGQNPILGGMTIQPPFNNSQGPQLFNPQSQQPFNPQSQQPFNPQTPIFNPQSQQPQNLLGMSYNIPPGMPPGMPPYNSQPQTMGTLQNSAYLQKFESDIQDKEQTIKELKQKINKFKSASEECLNEKEKLRRGENFLKNEIHDKDIQIQNNKKKISQQQDRIEELEQELRKLRGQMNNQEISLNFKIKNQKIQIDDQAITIKQLNEQIQIYLQNANNSNNSNSKLLMDMQLTLKKQIQELSDQVKKKNQEIEEMELNHQKNKAEWESRYLQNMQISQKENEDLLKIKKYEEDLQQMNRKMAILQQKMKEVQSSADNLQTLLAKKEQDIQTYKIENQAVKYELEIIKEKQVLYEHQVTKLSQNILSQNSNTQVQEVQDTFQQELKRLQEDADRKMKLQEANRIKLQQEEIQKKEELMRFKVQAQKQRRLNQKKQGQYLVKGMMESHGKIQVCFVVDVTGSMDEYKETTMKCIQGTMSNIKQQTNRDTIWATVAYQDFAEYEKLGNKYFEHPFTEDQIKIYNYLDKIKCDGGDDGAEDVRGGLKQMIHDLEWNKNFKMAILICDAPSHGAKWAGKVLDDHPNEDLSDALLKLIENKILLIGIIFDVRTRVMFKQMEQFYKEKDKSELLLIVEMEKMNHEQIKEALIKLISDASVALTHTKNAATHTKQNAKPKSNEGAMEALCKTGINPMNFDQQQDIKTTTCDFTIFRVEIKEDAFENKIEDIFSIKLPDNFKEDPKDFNIIEEGKWNCIRTVMPYAHGQMKSVYLMRKQQSRDEVYVIKMPINGTTYSSLEEALAECRSHLISKRLMSRFISDLKQQKQEKNSQIEIIEIVYSDFLILKESENSFWIAERFFQGDFVKFNNNYGFISDETNTLNRIAQAYSYYTYVTSYFNYVVNDVQGVGQYFTDPAINTQLGNFDETDIGEDGIGMYMVSLQKYKYLIKDYIDLLDMDLD